MIHSIIMGACNLLFHTSKHAINSIPMSCAVSVTKCCCDYHLRRSTNLNRGHCSIKCSGWEATIGQCLYDVITGVDVGVQQHPAPPRGLDSSNLEDAEHGFHNETLMGCGRSCKCLYNWI